MKNKKFDDNLSENLGKGIVWVVEYSIKGTITVVKFLNGGLKRIYYNILDTIKYRKFRGDNLMYSVVSTITPLIILREVSIPLHIKLSMSIVSLVTAFGLVYLAEKMMFIRDLKKLGLIAQQQQNAKYDLKLKYYSTRYLEDGIKVVNCNRSIPVYKLISKLDQYNKMSKYNILSIDEKNIFKFGYLQIFFSKNEKSPESLYYLSRLFNSMAFLIPDSKNVKYIDNFSSIDVLFDSEMLYQQVKNLRNELASRLKIKSSRVMITSSLDHDYKIVIDKVINVEKNFQKVYNNNLDDIKSKIIPWISGYDKKGNTVIYDLSKFSHMIVAGATGWGKSNTLHTLILSILLGDNNTELYLCDPKLNEFKDYKTFKKVNYYNDFDSILKLLQTSVDEMDNRNKIIEKLPFIRDIEGYNKKYTVNPMIYKVIMIDEVADLILQDESMKEKVKSFNKYLNRLIQAGRSVGFRVILSTQNPTKEVFKSFIKANTPTRVALHTTSSVDSRTIINNNLAFEVIDKKGKFVLQNNGQNEIIQGYFISDLLMVEIFSYIEKHSINYGTLKASKQVIDKDSQGLRNNLVSLEKTKIEDSKSLYHFYINLHRTDNILPVKKEIKQMTGLSDYYLRLFNDELYDQKLLRLLKNQKLQVVDYQDELNKKRIKKLEG